MGEGDWQVRDTMAAAVRSALVKALRETGSVTKAAQRLRIGRSTAYRLMARMETEPPAEQELPRREKKKPRPEEAMPRHEEVIFRDGGWFLNSSDPTARS